MLKKIVLTSAFLISTVSLVHASPAPYGGASIGINTNTTNNAGDNNAGNFRGVPINVFAGYGGALNQNFYLAGELTGTLATAEISTKNRAKTTYGYGASVLPGLLLNEHTLAYA